MSEDEFNQLVERLKPVLLGHIVSEKPWKKNLYIPAVDVFRVDPLSPFMRYSTCSAADFFHPEFTRILGQLGISTIRGGEVMTRGFWEYAFIVHHAFRTGAAKPGNRALVFGVGVEPIPALFAAIGMKVTATDAPLEIGVASGWATSTQFSKNLEELPHAPLDRPTFESRVEWRPCDMNAIDKDLTDYDLCWSCCSLEHLGDLRKGTEFIINSVENTLKIGGVAIFTTEFNLSSNTDTIESGPTVLYRRRDIEELIEELRTRGHTADQLTVAPDSLVIDGYVDTPPYSRPHLKLELGGYTATSIGLLIRRGR